MKCGVYAGRVRERPSDFVSACFYKRVLLEIISVYYYIYTLVG